VIRDVLWFCWAAFGVGICSMYAANRKVEARERRRRWMKLVTYFFIVNCVLLAAAAGWELLTPLLAIVLILGGYELRRLLHSEPAAQTSFEAAIWIGYGVLCAGLMLFARLSSPSEAVYTYLVVAFFDGFSQICGQLIGRHKLIRQLSPGKTVEGAVGGLTLAAVAGLALRGLVDLTAIEALAFSSAIVIAALAGDLAASWVKRRRGAKDFGRLLPWHGGVLDRFDSLLGAAPVSLLLFHFGR
jgi:phosphatidate cytidylyltransferase